MQPYEPPCKPHGFLVTGNLEVTQCQACALPETERDTGSLPN